MEVRFRAQSAANRDLFKENQQKAKHSYISREMKTESGIASISLFRLLTQPSFPAELKRLDKLHWPMTTVGKDKMLLP